MYFMKMKWSTGDGYRIFHGEKGKFKEPHGKMTVA